MLDTLSLIDGAVAAQREGRLADAEQLLREILLQNPRHAEALNDLGRLLLASGREGDAARCFEQAIASNPKLGQAHFNLATLLRRHGENTAAATYFERATRLLPDTAKTHYQLALVLRDLGRIDEAAASLHRAIELAPTALEPIARLADLFTETGQFAAAIEAHERVIELEPNRLASWLTMGCIHEALSQIDQAVVCFRKALSLDPELDPLRLKLAAAAFARREWDAAIEQCDAALARHPDWAEARFQRSLAMLRRGRLALAWPDFESRKACQAGTWMTHHLPDLVPDLDGGPDLTTAAVLVYGEGGPSAELLLASCLPDVLAEARRVVVECDPRLENLFARSFPEATVVAATPHPIDSNSPLARDLDGQIAMGSLPGRYRTQYRRFPEEPRYLAVDAKRAASWQARLKTLGRGKKVGVVRQREERSAALPWLDLVRTPGCQWIDLWPQAGPLPGASKSPVCLHAWSAREIERDVDDLAALVGSLDLVIATDHFTAHLAAAVGTPTWVILPEAVDWRWLLDERRSPWHPTMRLFRRKAGESWDDVMTQVRRELVGLLNPSSTAAQSTIRLRRAA